MSEPDDTLLDLAGYLDDAELRFASSESAPELMRAADSALDRLAGVSAPGVERAARRLRATALERQGDLPGAIAELLLVTAEPLAELRWLNDLISLSRCYRETGQLDKAIEAGESREAAVRDLGLDATTEAIQLVVTVAAAHLRRGDVAHSLRLCLRAERRAHELGLPVARASALWNASIARQTTGDAEGALALVLEALDLYEAHGDVRRRCILRMQVANVYLDQTPPDAARALELLNRSRRELDWTGVGAVEVARHRLNTARALQMLGDTAAAAEALAESEERAPAEAVYVRAWQLALRGRLAADARDLATTRACLHRATHLLTGSGSDTEAAQVWFRLGELYTEVGDEALAADAFRRAGISQGLTPRS